QLGIASPHRRSQRPGRNSPGFVWDASPAPALAEESIFQSARIADRLIPVPISALPRFSRRHSWPDLLRFTGSSNVPYQSKNLRDESGVIMCGISGLVNWGNREILAHMTAVRRTGAPMIVASGTIAAPTAPT